MEGIKEHSHPQTKSQPHRLCPPQIITLSAENKVMNLIHQIMCDENAWSHEFGCYRNQYMLSTLQQIRYPRCNNRMRGTFLFSPFINEISSTGSPFNRPLTDDRKGSATLAACMFVSHRCDQGQCVYLWMNRHVGGW